MRRRRQLAWRSPVTTIGRNSTRSAIAAAAAAALLVLAAAPPAHADRNEWRVAPVAVVGASNVRTLDRESWSVAAGGGLRAVYGVLDFLEVGLHTGLTVAPSLQFNSVTVGGQPGNLVATLYSPELSVDLRLLGDVNLSRGLGRLHPYLGIRGGALLRILASQQLLDAQRELVLARGTDVAVLPAVTPYAGFEYRFSRAWLFGLSGAFAWSSSDYYSALGTIELSWMTY